MDGSEPVNLKEKKGKGKNRTGSSNHTSDDVSIYVYYQDSYEF